VPPFSDYPEDEKSKLLQNSGNFYQIPWHRIAFFTISTVTTSNLAFKNIFNCHSNHSHQKKVHVSTFMHNGETKNDNP
jgi:hypothetical protein